MANTFIQLNDTPNVYVADSFLTTAANGNAIAYANTDTLVLTTGDQSIAGEKIFTSPIDIDIGVGVFPEALKVRSTRALYNTRFVDESNPSGPRNLDILMQAVDGQPGRGARLLYSAYGDGGNTDPGNVVGGLTFETLNDAAGPVALDSTIRFYTTPDLDAANAQMSIAPVGVTIGAGSTSYRLPNQDGTPDQVLRTSGTGLVSFVDLPPPGALELDGLSDVVIGTPTGGQSLVYDAANGVFVNQTITLDPNVVINTFIELDDTPNQYTPRTGNFVRISSNNRIVFEEVNLGMLNDMAFSYGGGSGNVAPADGEILEWSDSTPGPNGGAWRPVRNNPYTPGNGIDNDLLNNNNQLAILAPASGGLVSNADGLFIADTGVAPGVYGDGSNTAIVTVNSKGQITDVSTTPIVVDFNTVVQGNFVEGLDDTSTIEVVTPASNPAAYPTDANGNIVATPGFTGLSLVSTGITAGEYGGQSRIPVVRVDTYGRVTDINEVDFFANIDFGNANVDGLTSRAWSQIVLNDVANTIISADDPQDTLFMFGGDGIDLSGVNDGPEDEITFSVDNTVARNAFSQVQVLDSLGANVGWANADNSADTLELQSSDSINFVRSNTTANIARVEAQINDVYLTDFFANSSLNDFGDVNYDANTIGNTNVLAWDGANAQFVPQSLQVQQLGDIADVQLDANISTLSNNQILIYNASLDVWQNQEFSGSGGGNVSLAAFSVVQEPNAGTGNLTYDLNGTFTYTPPAPQTLAFDGPASELTISDGNTVDLSNISLANTAVTPGTYGSASGIPVITVEPDGRISNVTVQGAQAPGNAVERFRINYAPNGQLSLANNISTGITNITIDNPAGGDVTITFDSAYNFPPSAIMFYGYNYTNNKYFLVPFDAGVALREIEGGGVQGNPDLFNGTSDITMRLRLREADTGASRGGFGTQTHAYVQIML